MQIRHLTDCRPRRRAHGTVAGFFPRIVSFCFLICLIPVVSAAAENDWGTGHGINTEDLSSSERSEASGDFLGRQLDQKAEGSGGRRDGSMTKSGHNYNLSIRLTPWLVQPSGDATLGSLGTEVDLHDDVGLDSYEVTPAGTATLRLGRHDLWFDALVIDMSENSVVNRTITFGSLTVPANRSVKSDLELQMYDLRYGYSFFDADRHGFRLGPTLGVAYVDVDAKITDQVTGTSDTLSEAFPLPRLGLQGSVPLGPFELAGKAAGLYVEYKDFQAYTLEGDVSLTWRPLRNIGLVAGYRVMKTHAEFDVDKLDLTFQGPYAGAELRF